TEIAIVSSYLVYCPGRGRRARMLQPVALIPGWASRQTSPLPAIGSYGLTGAAAGLAAGAAGLAGAEAVVGFTVPPEAMLASTLVEKPVSSSAMRLLRLCR